MIIRGRHTTAGPKDIKVDNISRDMVIISQEHYKIHQGKHFVLGYAASKDAAASLIIRVKTPLLYYLHALFSVVVSDGCAVKIYEDSTYTHNAGNALTAFNSNRPSTNVSHIQQACHTPGGSETGTLIYSDRVGAHKSHGSISRDEELILKLNTVYSVVVTADGNGTEIAINLKWYEESSNG